VAFIKDGDLKFLIELIEESNDSGELDKDSKEYEKELTELLLRLKEEAVNLKL